MTYQKKPNEYHPNADLAQYTRLLKSEDYYKRTGTAMEEDRKEFLETADTKEMLRENVHRFNDISSLGMIAHVPMSHLYEYVTKKSLNELYQLAKNLEELLVNLFGLRYDNSAKFMFDLNGQKYSFAIFKHGSSYEMNMWNETGMKALHRAVIRGEHVTKEIVEDFIKKAQMYQSGLVPCSDCGNSIYKEDTGGTYFAGTYCKPCWHEKGWKEKERRESYN